MSTWQIEPIPDSGQLYMRAHKTYYTTRGVMTPGVFKDHGAAMSVEWDKYAEPEHTRGRALIPSDNAVISLEAGEVRKIDRLTVLHEPEDDVQAHSGVHGEKDPETRVQLRRIATEVIPLEH